MKSFTNQAKKDLPTDMSEEDYIRMYAAWGRFIDISATLIPWNCFIDYAPPEEKVLSEDEDGNMICETVIRLKYLVKKE